MNEQEKETARKLIAANSWRLNHLQLGAQRTDGQFPYRWRRGFGGDGPGLLRIRMLANLACAQARILVEIGHGQKAADLLGDVAIFAQDLSTNAPMQSLLIGTSVYLTAFDVLRSLLQEGKFTREEMENISRSLDAIDRDFPKVNAALSNSIMGEGRFLISASSTTWRERRMWVVDPRGARELDWRFTIAPRSYVLDAFEQMDPYLQRIANLEDLPYTEAKAQADQISAENQITIWSLGRDGIDQNGKSDDTYQPDMVIEMSL
jgi:hypothetical protein